MTNLKVLFVVALCLLINACSYTFVMADRSARKVKYFEQTNTFYLFGSIGSPQVDVHKGCGSDRIYKIVDHQTYPQFLISFFSLGLVQPRTASVTCGEPVPAIGGNKAELEVI